MSWLDSEIAEQPEVVGRLLVQLGALREWVAERCSTISNVVVVARGTSDNAARYAQYVIPLLSGVPVALAAPSLTTVYGATPRLPGALVVAVSQSGQSHDVVEVVTHYRRQGCPTLAVTNDPASPLAQASEHVVDLVGGAERSVAATKTYTASLTVVAALAAALELTHHESAASPMASPNEGSRQGALVPATRLAQLYDLPGLLHQALQLAAVDVEDTARQLVDAERMIVVGRGLNLSTAHETALKITELTGAQVAPYSPADLFHGPIGAVGPDVATLIVAVSEPATPSSLDVTGALLDRGSPVHLLAKPYADRPCDTTAAVVSAVAGPAHVPSWLTPITAIIPGQLLARHIAALRGVDLDRPGGLTKITLTR